MIRDTIKECGMTMHGKLYVKPSSQKFPYMYREAIGVQWDPKNESLSFPSSLESAKVDGFHFFSLEVAFGQILSGAKEQVCNLYLTKETIWLGIPEIEKVKIENTYLSLNR